MNATPFVPAAAMSVVLAAAIAMPSRQAPPPAATAVSIQDSATASVMPPIELQAAAATAAQTVPGELPRPTITGIVTLPDGSRWTAIAPLPSDPQGFTWRTFRSRAAPDKSIMGLHVYAQRQDPDLIVGTVRFSNGSVAPNGTRFCGRVYYDSFMLQATPGWEWVVLPQKGQATRVGVWAVAATPAVGSHLARPREMMEFAYALIPSGNYAARAKAEDALRYRDLVIPDPFVRYGPALSRLPTVSRTAYATVCADWVSKLLSAQAAGTQVYIENIADFKSDALGPHWMDGEPSEYSFGGYGIDPTAEFPEQVPDGVLAHAIMHRANVSRSFIAAFDIDTGKSISLYEWTSAPDPQRMAGEPGREGQVEIGAFLEGNFNNYHYPNFNTGTCDYEYGKAVTKNGMVVLVPGLDDFYAHDPAHSVRAMRNAIALVEYAHDPAARDFVLAVAERNRYSYFSDRPDERTRGKNPNDGYWATSLTSLLEAYSANRNQGGWFDRIWAWTAFSGACAIKYEPDPARKAQWKAWGKNMLNARMYAADKFGFSGRNFAPGQTPDTVSGIQTFHEMLVICHTVSLAAQVYGNLPPELAAINRRGLTSALSVLPARAYGGAVGPPHWIGTANNNVELPSLSNDFAYGEGDPAHVYAACALTYRADPSHPEILDLALKHWHPNADLPAMLAFCTSLFPTKNWSVQMESVLQQKLAH